MLLKNSLKHKKPSLESVLYILEEVNTLPIFGSEPMYIPFVSFFGEEKYKTIEEKAASIINQKF